MLPALALAAIPAIFQGVTGLIQKRRGERDLANLQRPEYKMPAEINQMLTLAAQGYQDPYSIGNIQARQDIGLSQANAIAAAQAGGDPNAMIPTIQAQSSRAYNQAAVAQDQLKQQQLASLSDMLGIRAKYKDVEYQQNEYGPYVDKYNQYREQIGAGQQNMFGGLDALASIGIQLGSLANARNAMTPQQAAGMTTDTLMQGGNLQGLISRYAQQAQGYARQYAPQLQMLARNYPY